VEKTTEEGKRQLKLIKRLKFYPMILIVCWIFGTINRVYLFVAPNDPQAWLTILHVFFGSINGLFNAIVYGISGPVKVLIVKTCCPCFAPRKKKKQEDLFAQQELPEKPMDFEPAEEESKQKGEGQRTVL
jgi:hypothetical protein